MRASGPSSADGRSKTLSELTFPYTARLSGKLPECDESLLFFFDFMNMFLNLLDNPSIMRLNLETSPVSP